MELTPLIAVGDRTDQGQFAGRQGGTGQRDPALDESSQHGEEPTAGGLNGGGVAAIGCDIAVAVEQIGPGDTDTLEADLAVVDTVETALMAVVGDVDPGQDLTVVVTQMHVEAVHPMVDPIGDQLSEDHRILSCRAALPRNRLVAASKGVWMTNSSVCGS